MYWINTNETSNRRIFPLRFVQILCYILDKHKWSLPTPWGCIFNLFGFNSPKIASIKIFFHVIPRSKLRVGFVSVDRLLDRLLRNAFFRQFNLLILLFGNLEKSNSVTACRVVAGYNVLSFRLSFVFCTTNYPGPQDSPAHNPLRIFRKFFKHPRAVIPFISGIQAGEYTGGPEKKDPHVLATSQVWRSQGHIPVLYALTNTKDIPCVCNSLDFCHI